MVFSHGFGCDQNMWRFVWPAFADRFRIVLFDHVGAGGSDLAAYDPEKYSSLDGYAEDIVEICRELEIAHGVFVGHSVSSMIGALASLKAPGIFDELVMIGPSPRYINDGDYTGGFSEQQIHELLDFLDANHMGWSRTMAPVIMGNPDRPELNEELTNSFCMTDPDIARKFARATFLSDNRADLPLVKADAAVDDLPLEFRTDFQKVLVLLLRAKTHHMFYAGPIVPTPVVDHDFPGRGEVS